MAASRWTEDPRIAAVEEDPRPDYPLEVRRHWVEDLIAQRPGSFEFFQLVRLMCRMGNGLYPPGLFPKHPDQEVVRFGVNPAYWFPPSDLSQLKWPKFNDEKFEWKPPMLRVNFMGMIGPSGVLPLVYSDFVNERLRARDRTMLEFFDLFHHRLISLFYQAWEKYRFWVGFERQSSDRMAGYLMDFLGIGTPGLENRQQVSDSSLMFYTGLLSLVPRSALALQQVLSDFFDVPVRVEEFGGSWYPLTEQDICQFADPATEAEQLGLGVVVGDAVWDRASRAKIQVGPLGLEEYRSFLPGGSAHKPLEAITNFFTNGEIIFEVQLILDRDSVPKCQLGMETDAPPMLGWLTWMNLGQPRAEDPGDTVFLTN
jgi:type VI secretion system protein ImpH